MTNFEDVMSKAKDVAEAAGKKTSELIDIARLKIEAGDIERDISAMLEGLGRLVYESRKKGEDISSAVDSCALKLDERYAQLAEVREKIDEYKNMIRCKNCGTPNTEDSVFCKKCGNKVI